MGLLAQWSPSTATVQSPDSTSHIGPPDGGTGGPGVVGGTDVVVSVLLVDVTVPLLAVRLVDVGVAVTVTRGSDVRVSLEDVTVSLLAVVGVVVVGVVPAGAVMLVTL